MMTRYKKQIENQSSQSKIFFFDLIIKEFLSFKGHNLLQNRATSKPISTQNKEWMKTQPMKSNLNFDPALFIYVYIYKYIYVDIVKEVSN